jgi:hypothetical protein
MTPYEPGWMALCALCIKGSNTFVPVATPGGHTLDAQRIAGLRDRF